MVAIYMNKFVFPKYGKCQLTVAKEGFMNSLASVVLPKNSPYTPHINRE